MSSQIQNVIEHALGDGARAAKFEVVVAMPSQSMYSDEQAIATVAKTASFPGKSHDIIDVKYKGRSIPVKGQTKYSQTWDCTFYASEDHRLKTAFEDWVESIDGKHNYRDYEALGEESNVSAIQKKIEANYTMRMIISQMNFGLDEERIIYTLHNCFPISVGSIEANSESTGSISEFAVTFAYSYYSTQTHAEQTTAVDGFVNDLKQMATDAVGAATLAIDNVIGDLTGGIFGTESDTIEATDDDIAKEVSNAVENQISSFTPQSE